MAHVKLVLDLCASKRNYELVLDLCVSKKIMALTWNKF